MSRLRVIENILDRAGYPRGAVISNPEEARTMLVERLRQLAAGRWNEPDADDHQVIEGQVDVEG